MKQIAIAALCCVLAGAGAAEANDPPPFKDFKPRFVKPPKAGQKPKLVQVDPSVEAPAPAAPKASGTKTKTASTRYDWFWDKVSPAMADLESQSGAVRLETAMSTLARSDQRVPVPRLQTLQAVVEARGTDILRATIGTNVSPALALAVIWTESAGKVDAQSGAGAQGLMQLMPATAERFGVSDPFVAQDNIKGGVKYLDWLMREFEGDPMLVLAAYNAGEGAVRKHQGVPPYSETRDYVPKVLATYQLARGLCITPPQLLSDGCVFAGMGS